MAVVICTTIHGYHGMDTESFLRELKGLSEIQRDDEPTQCFPKGNRCDAQGADYCCDCCSSDGWCVTCPSGCRKSGYKGCHSNSDCCSGKCTRVYDNEPASFCVYRGHPGLGR
uniref:Venom peptide U19-SYTX-Sth1a n=1 Tax=Scytodes thoracica TaxID=1112478 RepID=A0A0A0V7G4_SCYTH|nr:venom peptide U19-SYTX-Sth1a [Scytodes thoracica]